MSINRFAHLNKWFQVSVFRCQVSGRWPLVTGYWPEARNQQPAAKMLTPSCAAASATRGKDLTPDTRHLYPEDNLILDLPCKYTISI